MSTEIINPQLVDKIGKLVRLFASDKDGEVLASVRALGRVLESNDLSFDSLAELFNHNIARLAYRDGREAGCQEGLHARTTQASARHRRYDDVTEEVEDDVPLSEVVRFCYERQDQLRQRDPSFVSQMVRYIMRGWKLSEKQEDWLRGIYGRLREKETT